MEQVTAVPHFMVIDDDPINNLICSKVIGHTFPGMTVSTYLNPEYGLDYIGSNGAGSNSRSMVLFLDINMPFINGWDVLERFGEFPEAVRGHVKIFMLSSSIWPEDKERADNCSYVSGFISKPLTKQALVRLFPEYV